MTEPTQPEFYRPWPLFGKKLSNQWGESRQNSEVLAALVQAAGLDLDDPLGNSDLMSWELGQLDFHNRFRFIYDDVNTGLKIQKNTGTEGSPVWVTALFIDYETLTTSISGTLDFNFNPFYLSLDRVALHGLNQIQPTEFYNVTSLYFSSDDGFYFTTGPGGSPVVRLSDRVTSGGSGGISNVTFVSGDNTFLDDKLNFNPNTFYLTGTTDGSPQVNLENVILQDTSVPVIGPGGTTLLDLHSTANIDSSGLVGFKFTDKDEDIFWFFASTGGVDSEGATKNWQIYEPGTLTVSGSNTNRFMIIGPGLGKGGFGGFSSPVSNQLVMLRDGKIIMGTTSLEHTDYTYKLTAGGSVAATSFYITNNQGSAIGAKELKIPTFTTTDLEGTLVPKRYESDKLTFDRSDFYISPDSSGKPVVSLTDASGGGTLTSVLVKTTDLDGTFTPPDFNTDKITFNRADFYISPDSSGKPIINIAQLPESGLGDQTIVSGVKTEVFPSSVEWIFNHNLNGRPLLWGIYDPGFSAILPDKLDISNPNIAYFYFSEATAGTAIVSTGRTSVDFPGLAPGFYGVNVKDTSDKQSYNRIKTISFNFNDFYISQNTPNTDEAIVNSKQITRLTVNDNIGKQFVTNKLNFSNANFYLTGNASNEPVVNLTPSIVTKSSLIASLIANQTSNLAVGDHIKWSNKKTIGDKIFLDTTTTYTSTSFVPSLGRFKLAPGTYLITSAAYCGFSSTINQASFEVRRSNGTGIGFIGGLSVPSIVISVNYSLFTISNQPVCSALLTIDNSTKDFLWEIRLTVATSLTNIQAASTWLNILEL